MNVKTTLKSWGGGEMLNILYDHYRKIMVIFKGTVVH